MFYGSPSNKAKYLERFKAKDKFINMVNHFGISKFKMVFKVSIVKFLNSHPKMKKSSLSLHFLKNNFKIFKEICRENATEFK